MSVLFMNSVYFQISSIGTACNTDSILMFHVYFIVGTASNTVSNTRVLSIFQVLVAAVLLSVLLMFWCVFIVCTTSNTASNTRVLSIFQVLVLPVLDRLPVFWVCFHC